MRCPRCFYEVPVDADQCPRCKLATPKIQQAGVSTGIAGKYAAPQAKKKIAPGKTGKLTRAQTKPELKLSKWQLVAIFGGVLVLSGALGYGISEYRFWNAPPPTVELGALHLVERAKAKQGGTIGEALTAYLVELVESKKVDQAEGWRVECQGSKCKVTYTVKLIGQEPQTAVWEVDVAAKTVSPQNSWAMELTK
ncbi:MAG: hypothetical protein NZ585_13480 [Chloracidobacterium sp.]|nr:hypothetical protein [Chloracidobacterium sp.]MDW8218848.1 hypothetical protein [Acidobacteriota bacterium]